MSLLSRFGSEEIPRAEALQILSHCFEQLLEAAVDGEFPRTRRKVRTRMARTERRGVYDGEIIDPRTEAVCLSILRAGAIPSQVCFEMLMRLLNPDHVRQDFLMLNRRKENGVVTGADLLGAKVGGTLKGRILIAADPMGATGGTLEHALRFYREAGHGRPLRVLSLHLIITPEFIRKVHSIDPEIRVYAIRLDRGMSAARILKTLPGTHLSREQGLNEHQYIVPGAGGIGEVLNNTRE